MNSSSKVTRPKQHSVILYVILTMVILTTFIHKYSKNVAMLSEELDNVSDQLATQKTLNEQLIAQQNETYELVSEIAVDVNHTVELLEVIEPLKEENPEEWYSAYRVITKCIDNPNDTIYDSFSEDELEKLFKVVQAEIGDEYSFEQKANVATIIFNRLASDEFPNTLDELLVTNQFETISNDRYNNVTVSDKTIMAVEYAFLFGNNALTDCLFFDSNKALTKNYELVYSDSAHNFYKLKDK